jgi:hypothetical protein
MLTASSYALGRSRCRANRPRPPSVERPLDRPVMQRDVELRCRRAEERSCVASRPACLEPSLTVGADEDVTVRVGEAESIVCRPREAPQGGADPLPSLSTVARLVEARAEIAPAGGENAATIVRVDREVEERSKPAHHVPRPTFVIRDEQAIACYVVAVDASLREAPNVKVGVAEKGHRGPTAGGVGRLDESEERRTVRLHVRVAGPQEAVCSNDRESHGVLVAVPNARRFSAVARRAEETGMRRDEERAISRVHAQAVDVNRPGIGVHGSGPPDAPERQRDQDDPDSGEREESVADPRPSPRSRHPVALRSCLPCTRHVVSPDGQEHLPGAGRAERDSEEESLEIDWRCRARSRARSERWRRRWAGERAS